MASDTKIQFKSISIEAFPVGSVFLSIVNTNPSTLLGYGTWSLIGDGRMIMGATADDDVTKTLTGGSMSKSVPLLSHTHTGPSHTHTFTTGNQSANHTHSMGYLRTDHGYGYAKGASSGTAFLYQMLDITPTTGANSTNHTHSGTTAASGTGNTGSTGTANVTMDVTNSYIKLKIWKRTE